MRLLPGRTCRFVSFVARRLISVKKRKIIMVHGTINLDCCGSLKKLLTVLIIHHGCEVQIEKSVRWSLFGITRLLLSNSKQ